MRKQKNALIGALVWWFASRWLRKRAARTATAVPGVGGAGGGRGGLARAVGGALALVAALAAGFVLWRKLSGKRKGVETPMPPAPEPLRPATATPVETTSETPPAPAAA